eukprot:gene11741-15711_t
MDSLSISDLKKNLEKLGISTVTPGLTGEDRYEELKSRYDMSTMKISYSISDEKYIKNKEGNNIAAESSRTIPSLVQLSMGELRSRLAALGENTNTPGLVGEDRRNELMRRLVKAICGEELSTATNRVIPQVNLASNKTIPLPSPLPQQNEEIKSSLNNSTIVDDDSISEVVDINGLKKQLKRIQNKRAMYVASKLSGDSQDEMLKSCEKILVKVENELMSFRLMKQQKGNVELDVMRLQSDLIDFDQIHSSVISIDQIIHQLDSLRNDCKEQVRLIRLKIRDEADSHPEFGIAMEEKLKIIMSNANLLSSKSKTRNKIEQVKTMDSIISTTINNDNNNNNKSIELSIDLTVIPEQIPANISKSHSQDMESARSSPRSQKNEKLKAIKSMASPPQQPPPTNQIRVTPKPPSSSSPSYAKHLSHNSNNSSNINHPYNPTFSKVKDASVDANIIKDTNSAVTNSIEDSKDEVKLEVYSQVMPVLSASENGIENDSHWNYDEDEFLQQDQNNIINDNKPNNIDFAEINKNSNNAPNDNITPDNARVQASLSKPFPMKMKSNINEEEEDDSEEDDEEDEKTQIKVLRDHAKFLENSGLIYFIIRNATKHILTIIESGINFNNLFLDDFQAAEILHERALELDPTNIKTLQGFAIFLHHKKGELARAEAFFNRALQICLPDFIICSQSNSPQAANSNLFKESNADYNERELKEDAEKENNSNKNNNLGLSIKSNISEPSGQGFKVRHIILLLKSYAKFLTIAKGDVDNAIKIYRKAIEIEPNNAMMLATFAHFLTLEGHGSMNEALKMFQQALHIDPTNPLISMWYAKLLKRSGKLAQ